MKKHSFQIFFAVLALVSAACTCGGGTESNPLPGNISFNDAPCVMNQLSDGDAPANGQFKLDWSDQPGAGSYKVDITRPDAQKINLDSNSSEASLEMSGLPDGTYSVLVIAYDPYGNPICMFGWSFEKHSAASEPEKPKKTKEPEGSGSSAQPTAAPTDDVAK